MENHDEQEGHSAEFMDGKTASIHSVRVVVSNQGLRIVDTLSSTCLEEWPLEGLQSEVLPDGHAVQVRHALRPNALLTSQGHELAASLRLANVSVSGLPQGNRLRNLIIANSVAVALLVAGGYWALPYVASVLAKQVPMSLEKGMGEKVDLLFEGNYCESKESAAALGALQKRIEGSSAPPRELRILNMDVPNAFTFPGGRIVVTRGLLREAQSADELAGIVAHEIQHVEQRHIMAHVIRGAVLTAGWAVTAGDFTGILVVDPSTAFQIANLRFSRGDEESADNGAVAMLDAAQIPRDGMVRFFDRLKSKSDVVPEWLSTHPSSARRAHDLAAPTGVKQSAGLTVLSDESWEALKHACDKMTDNDQRTLRQILFGR